MAVVAAGATLVVWGTTAASAAVGNVTPPTVVTSSYRVGSTLYAAPGTWSGNPTSYSFKWKKCKLDPGKTCVDIPGETGPTHVVTAADTIWQQSGFLPERSFMYGIRIAVEVTATDGASSATALSQVDHTMPSVTTAPVGGATQTFGAPPAGVPEIDGAISPVPDCRGNTGPLCTNPLGWYYKIAGRYPLPEGGTLSSFTAYFAGGAAPQQFTPAIYRVDSSGSPTRLVVRGTPFTVPAGAPAGWFTTPLVTPVTVGPGTYYLAFLGGATDRGAIPYFYIPAQSIGVANVNRNLDPTQPGYLDESLVPSDGFGDIEHEAGEIPKAYVTYTPTAASTSLPGNTAAPALTGTAQQGQTLAASTGSWTGSPSGYAFQWQRCDAGGGSCVDVAGQVASSYALGAADVGSRLRATVRAVNDAGASTPVASAASAAVTGVAVLPPVNTALPVVSGTARAGQTLTVSNGTWSNAPTSFGYQWQRCNAAGAACAPIGGATAATYTAVAGDVASTLRAVVTASNTAGPGSATSAPTGVVAAAPGPAPANTALPVVSGTAQSGQTLTVSNGTWSNAPTSFAYQWQRCNAAGAACSPIGGATAASLLLGATDVGSTLRAAVTATNAGGPATAVSAASAVVAAAPVPPAPPAPPAPGGGGSGGGAPDLAVTQTASTAVAAAGDTILYRIDVQLKNAASTSGASGIVLTDTLPAGVQLVSTKANRGPGCAGTTTLTCPLDFLSGGLVATVEVVVRVTTAGTLVNTVSAKAAETDPDTTNNTSSVTVTPPVAPLTPPVGVVAPKLIHRPVSAQAVLRPIVKAKKASLATRVAIDRKATVTLRVRDAKTGKPVSLQAGSRLGGTTLTAGAASVTTTFASAKLFGLEAVLGAPGAAKGKTYVVVLTAAGATGKGTQLSLRFVG